MLSASVVWPPRLIFSDEYPLLHQTPEVPRRPVSCLELSLFKSLPRHRDPSYAPGLVSNAFRRNAAHFFGKYATPVSLFTISGRGYPVFEKVRASEQLRPRFSMLLSTHVASASGTSLPRLVSHSKAISPMVSHRPGLFSPV